ncbi:hypothetical protein GBAR_LOCUS27976 [Geodia barretti]|uniref:Uncharacterized protein n=1 Tax=Geodia barretti TaxID=519541 RepID=A0AA35TQ42_GEOBA|nr:hypothetical protein GBAR_LOCUS27976 [Geodia barretti]
MPAEELLSPSAFCCTPQNEACRYHGDCCSERCILIRPFPPVSICG